MGLIVLLIMVDKIAKELGGIIPIQQITRGFGCRELDALSVWCVMCCVCAYALCECVTISSSEALDPKLAVSRLVSLWNPSESVLGALPLAIAPLCHFVGNI